MNGDEVRVIRERLSKELGKHLGQVPFGVGVGISENNAQRTLRRWEEDGPSGPGAVGLGYLRQGLETTMPEFIKGKVAEDDGTIGTYIVRLHWPRFVARVVNGGFEEIEWIDQEYFGAPIDVIQKLAFKDAPIS